jgi:CheY-like chemotaxis protein/signal transduction histidine kinase/DNA-binding LacI/PurR family transcriptional regulator
MMSKSANQKSGIGRPTIGLLIANISRPWELQPWLGVVDEAFKQNVNLLCFPGRELRNPNGFEAQGNVLYDLVNTQQINGLVLWQGGFGENVSAEDIETFCARYRPLPVVSVENKITGYPSVIMDNYQAMREGIVHLIKVHGYRRIAYVMHEGERPRFLERYQAYVDTLAEYGIPFDSELISPPFNLAEQVTQWLKDIRSDCQAIASFSDSTVLQLLPMMKAMGIQIPQEMAVIGFDDVVESRILTPPLSTVHPPFYEMGRKAVETLVTLMQGGTVPDELVVPSRMTVRESCGCKSTMLTQVAMPPALKEAPSLDKALTTHRQKILSEMQQALQANGQSHQEDHLNRLLDSFMADRKDPKSQAFISTLGELLNQVVAMGDEALIWQDVISAMRRQVNPYLEGEALSSAEVIWQQARVMVGELAQRSQAYQAMQAEKQANILADIGQMVITTHDIADLMEVLARELPRANIPSGFLSLYDDPAAPVSGASLRLAYDENGCIDVPAEQQHFLSAQLVPEGRLPQNRRYSSVVEPLFFREQQIGFALLEIGPRSGSVYEILRGQISSALQGALLVEQVKERAAQLDAAAKVSSITSSILNPSELIRQTVDLVRERFNFYYVGLFLTDASGEYAVLKAGTGEAGQKMLSQGHRLAIGNSSMVGWCIANHQARLALDVGKEAVRFNNPLLTETRSELALPLVSHGEAIGALTIQSSQPAAFSGEDVLVLQTMADQLANGIEKARLYEQAQQRTVELTQAREAAETARWDAEQEKEKSENAKEEAEKARHEAEAEKEKAEAANRTLASQMWQTNGQSLLNHRIRGEQNVPTLGLNVIQQLCQYLGAQSGVLYVMANETTLKLAGTYAQREDLANTIQLGHTMLGQAAIEKRPINIIVPDNYLAIAYAQRGEFIPKYSMVLPFVYEKRVIGVVKLESFTEFAPAQMEFLNNALETVAIAFITAQARERVNELLAQTRQQAEELQSQEEELRATNEELEAQTESLRNSETRLKQNQAALEAANADLEEKTEVLQKQQVELDRQNQILRDAQQELERKAEELAQASKYKSEFLANMSHELRTPLNSMLILAGMLAKNESGHLSADEVESAQVIHSGGTDLLNLINEILDLAKVEAGKMEFRFAHMEWDLLIARMHAQFDPIAERKGLAFTTTIAEDLPSGMITDEQRLAQIVKNLLSNAFKFTEQGSIALSIQRAANDAHQVAISVSDTGIGMTPEQQKVVFEAFQQADGSTSRQYGGTGLGLTITREMTHRLGGQVALTSEPGKGSTFTIYLPLKGVGGSEQDLETSDPRQATRNQAATPAAAPHSSPVPALPNQQPTISNQKSIIPDDRDDINPTDRVLLIVEDDPKFAKIVLNYAHKKHFKCLVAGDGESALALTKTHRPAAIILDLKLPGMSGWDVLDAIKDDPDLRHIPIHIMSVDDEDVSAYQRGAMGFLTKPISQKALEGAFGKIETFISSKIRSLLLVEDDAALRLSVRKLLDGSDVAITEAATGQGALQALATQPFDCMILDLSLPDISGFELLNRLDGDEALPKCPVIIYTGKELSPEENQELLKYADSVIVKGVKSPERLLDETTLFLHRVVADLPADQQQTIRKLHNREAVLQGKQILIVDDDARNAFALSRLLSERGVKMHIAPSATKALEKLEHLEVSLILTDIMMPGMDGYEFIKALRQQPSFQKLPIIALTAKAMKGDREKCIEAGANDYLSKPIDPERLFSMLRVWLSKE